MQKTDIWMPLYIGDYLADTARLTTEQHGAYLLLLMDYWRSGRLPDNDQILAQICKLSPDAWSNAKAMLMQFFNIQDGYWIHTRVEKELALAMENKAKMHDRASKAAQARWDKPQNNATSNAQAMHKECPSPSPLPSPTSLTTTTKTITPEGVSDSIFKDYMEVRKAKKAKWTETALKGLQRESEKAKITLQEAMQICCERGWIGFKAEWIQQEAKKAKELPLGTHEQIEQAYRVECGKDPALARFNSYFDMRDYIVKFREERAKA
jgi:uncharacterized protein YdaU (DUF1376 family)